MKKFYIDFGGEEEDDVDPTPISTEMDKLNPEYARWVRDRLKKLGIHWEGDLPIYYVGPPGAINVDTGDGGDDFTNEFCGNVRKLDPDSTLIAPGTIRGGVWCFIGCPGQIEGSCRFCGGSNYEFYLCPRTPKRIREYFSFHPDASKIFREWYDDLVGLGIEFT